MEPVIKENEVPFLTLDGLSIEKVKDVTKKDLVTQVKNRHTHISLTLILLDALRENFNDAVIIDQEERVAVVKNNKRLLDVDFLIDAIPLFLMQEGSIEASGLNWEDLKQPIFDALTERVERMNAQMDAEAAVTKRETLLRIVKGAK